MLQSRMLFWKMELFGGRGGDTARDGENSVRRKEECARGDIRRRSCGGICGVGGIRFLSLVRGYSLHIEATN